MIDDEYPADRGTSTRSTSPTATTGRSTTRTPASSCSRRTILPHVNLFCYGQVESPYGSGQFIKDLTEHFDEDERVVTSEIKGKDAIMDSIKEFLGKGEVSRWRRSSASRRTCATCRKRSRATREGYGLDFFPILYEVLDYKTMNEVAAYGGFPTRYPHWRFGMDYEQLSKSYEYGLSKIYEMVINNNPATRTCSRATRSSTRRSSWRTSTRTSTSSRTTTTSRKTNRKMIDGMANHATRVRRHIERHGQDASRTSSTSACRSRT